MNWKMERFLEDSGSRIECMVCGLISQVTQTSYIFFLCNHAVHEGCETRLDGVCLAPRCAKPLEVEIRLTPEMVSQRRFLNDYLQRLENFEDAHDEMKALMNDMAVKTRDVERHFGPLISKEYIASIETLRKMEKSRIQKAIKKDIAFIHSNIAFIHLNIEKFNDVKYKLTYLIIKIRFLKKRLKIKIYKRLIT